MPSAPKKFYIKERHNPQLGVYYVPCGQMSKTAAKQAGLGIYGMNVMIPFDSEEEYQQELEKLRAKGERVH